MREIIYIASENGISVKTVMKNEYKLSSSVITALKNSNGIRVNNEVVTVRKIMNKNDTLSLVFPEENSGTIVPTPGKPDILYEDEDILCVNKPSGMPTHPSQNHHDDTLANIICHYYDDIPFTFRVSNRLDSYTSGIVIIAKNIYSASFLCAESFRKNMNKTYYALCRGIFENKHGVVIAPIGRCDGSTIKRRVCADGKYAETHYRILNEENGNSWVELKLKTGRTHQIRVHMAYLGHPLLNDFLYDDMADESQKYILHCGKINFVHPCTKQNMNIEAPYKKSGFAAPPAAEVRSNIAFR